MSTIDENDLAGDEIDYQQDWAGEVRTDPKDGNSYVLRRIWRDDSGSGLLGDYIVDINDIFGGHRASVVLETWLKWEVQG